MHLLFVDESGHPDDPLFSIGGLAVRADHWRLLDRNLGQVTQEFGWDPIKEFTWHEIVTRVVPHQVGDKAFSAIAATPVTVFVPPAPSRRGQDRRKALCGSRGRL